MIKKKCEEPHVAGIKAATLIYVPEKRSHRNAPGSLSIVTLICNPSNWEAEQGNWS